LTAVEEQYLLWLLIIGPVSNCLPSWKIHFTQVEIFSTLDGRRVWLPSNGVHCSESSKGLERLVNGKMKVRVYLSLLCTCSAHHCRRGTVSHCTCV